MPKCTEGVVDFGRVGRRVVRAAFDGGDIVSDGGVMLLRQIDALCSRNAGECHAPSSPCLPRLPF